MLYSLIVERIQIQREHHPLACLKKTKQRAMRILDCSPELFCTSFYGHVIAPDKEGITRIIKGFFLISCQKL